MLRHLINEVRRQHSMEMHFVDPISHCSRTFLKTVGKASRHWTKAFPIFQDGITDCQLHLDCNALMLARHTARATSVPWWPLSRLPCGPHTRTAGSPGNGCELPGSLVTANRVRRYMALAAPRQPSKSCVSKSTKCNVT